jgi:CRISPR/Cas system-associated exonuclease Cas4 (RecB family)
VYSASGRKRGRACLYWARSEVANTVKHLPVYKESATGTRVGSALHEAAEEIVEDAGHLVLTQEELAEKWDLSETATKTLAMLRASWAEFWADFHKGKPWRSEVPFAFDVATSKARELEVSEHRGYKISATEIPGTLDLHLLERVRPNGSPSKGQIDDVISVSVLDIKTGKPPKHVGDHLDQLMHNALCVARVAGPEVKFVRVGIAHVMTDSVRVEWRHVSLLELEVTAAELRREHATIQRGPVPESGIHCRELFCPARAVCPTTLDVMAAAARVLNVQSIVAEGPVTSEAQAIALFEALPSVAAWAEERLGAVKRFADSLPGGLRWPDGRVFMGREQKTDQLNIDSPGAEDALRTVLGDATSVAVERKATKSSIERAARTIAAKGKLEATKDAAIEAMRGAGAITIKYSKRYELKKEK